MTLPEQLPPDYHTHTALCGHAEGSPLDYARLAERRGVPALAVTDHVPFASGYAPQVRMEPEEYAGYQAAVAQARQAYPELPILLGIEADFFVGCETELASWLEARSLDLVLGSVHWIDWNPDHPRGLFDGGDPTRLWTDYFDMVGRLADSGLYDIVAHLDLPKKHGVRLAVDVMRELALPALDRIAAAGMSIEINTSGIIHPIGEFYPSPELLTWACEREISLTFGSDAHFPERVGDRFGEAVNLAKAAGYTESARYQGRKATLFPLPD